MAAASLQLIVGDGSRGHSRLGGKEKIWASKVTIRCNAELFQFLTVICSVCSLADPGNLKARKLSSP